MICCCNKILYLVQFAIVLLGALFSRIQALILVWNEKQKHFTGLIPLDQVKPTGYN